MNPRNNTPPNMYSPRLNASQGYNSPRNNAPSRMYLPMNNSPQDFNTSRGMYSPNNSFQGAYSPQSSPHGMYSPMNTSQNMFSPRNTSQAMYSHRNSLPMRQQMYRKPFNKSRNSSDFNSSNQSFSSNESFSPRGRPYDRWNKKGGRGHSEQPYNIQNYINSSMLEDPWAESGKGSKKGMHIGMSVKEKQRLNQTPLV